MGTRKFEDRDLLDALSKGLSLKEAAAQLGVAVGTVHSRLSRLRKRFGARSTLVLLLKVRGAQR